MIREEDFNERIFGGDEPPPRNSRKVDVVSAKCGTLVRAVITSNKIIQCRTHWLGSGESKPCLRNPSCPWCQQRIGASWKGYLAGISTVTRNSVLIEITSGAAESCPTLLDQGYDLRGKMIVLGRNGQSSRGRAFAKLEEAPHTLRKGAIPGAFDVVKVLFKLWRFDPTDYESVNLGSGEIQDPRIIDE